jgi:hypothetical protein
MFPKAQLSRSSVANSIALTSGLLRGATMPRSISVCVPLLALLSACATHADRRDPSILDVLDESRQARAGSSYNASTGKCDNGAVTFCVSEMNLGPPSRCTCLSPAEATSLLRGGRF